jgi:hypothetical protein
MEILEGAQALGTGGIGVILSIFIWFLKRLINQLDSRDRNLEERIQALISEVQDIKEILAASSEMRDDLKDIRENQTEIRERLSVLEFSGTKNKTKPKTLTV